ncbi:hypothetical protein BY458DRAFT_212399 [Sporodiniella umbellata]|nr:hypothetical protein BY458DRAFT_212399 [Sporodiniella umbellata]
MSTSYNVDYTTHLQNTQCFMTPIDELKRQAFIDRSNIESYDIKNWVNIATQNYDHGDIAINRNDLENAYVAYMKGSTIMVEIVRHHSGYSAIKADPVYVSLRKKTDKTLGVLKDLAKRIDNWHSYQHQLQQMSTHYTPIPYTQMGTYADIPGQAPSFRPRSSPLKHTSNGLSYELSNKLFLETPSWTNSSYSTIPMIQPQYLASCIQSQQNPPKVLLIDVRSRNAFMSGCVQHKWIIQIDPSILKNE